MTTVKIEKKNLRNYLDRLSKVIPTELVEIEVAGLDLGDQIEAEWLPLTGISYDPKNDVVSIALDNGKIDHLIRGPVEFWVEEDGTSLKAISVKCAEGLQHLVRFKEPKKLPLPRD